MRFKGALHVGGAGDEQLADDQAEGESFGYTHGAHQLRGREHAVPSVNKVA
mgnify:CR=1 FL=1